MRSHMSILSYKTFVLLKIYGLPPVTRPKTMTYNILSEMILIDENNIRELTCKEMSSGCNNTNCLIRSSSRFTRVVYLRFSVSRSRATLSTVITESLRGLFTDASNDGQISSNCSLNARSLCP